MPNCCSAAHTKLENIHTKRATLNCQNYWMVCSMLMLCTHKHSVILSCCGKAEIMLVKRISFCSCQFVSTIVKCLFVRKSKNFFHSYFVLFCFWGKYYQRNIVYDLVCLLRAISQSIFLLSFHIACDLKRIPL